MSDQEGQAEDPREERGDIPPYDPAAVGRVAKVIELRNIELLHAHFERSDDEPLPAEPSEIGPVAPEVLLDVAWDADQSRALLGYVVRFGAVSEDPSFRVYAFFRLVYEVAGDVDFEEAELEQFGHWNAVFNAWPYFREYVSSTVNRAGLPRLVLPVMRVPRRDG